ncbi:hypothetical protein N431DRAFT_344844 [Stipitochalara longipes BDJ]|nr:hypothetical protein N431DRAFT_344844 [Stipitochalara longipes BDJ]
MSPLSQASAQASETYGPQATLPTEARRSSRKRTTTEKASQPKKITTAAEKKQIKRDEEVSRKLEDEGREEEPQLIRKKAKHAPKRRCGDRPIAEGLDRENAIVGKVDRSKLEIRFFTEREDPEHKGRTIAGKEVRHDYLENHAEPDWNSVEDMRILNDWRRRIFHCNFGPSGKGRPLWLQTERKLVLDLMRQQLVRQNSLKWHRLANTYNQQMALAGTIQNSGEECYHPRSSHYTGLKETRNAPFRSSNSMRKASANWPEYQELVRSFKTTGAGDQSDDKKKDNIKNRGPESDDDEEIPNPDPTAPKTTPANKQGTKIGVRRRGKGTKQGAKSDKVAEPRLSSDDSDSDEDIPARVPAHKRAKKNISRMRCWDDSDEGPMFPGLVGLMKKK